MRIYFVRHGEPNYEKDCLTETGKKQAMAVANCLKDLGIEKVFSSTNDRALETASYTAKLLGLDVVPCDFMRGLWHSLMSAGQLWLQLVFSTKLILVVQRERVL